MKRPPNEGETLLLMIGILLIGTVGINSIVQLLF